MAGCDLINSTELISFQSEADVRSDERRSVDAGSSCRRAARGRGGDGGDGGSCEVGGMDVSVVEQFLCRGRRLSEEFLRETKWFTKWKISVFRSGSVFVTYLDRSPVHKCNVRELLLKIQRFAIKT
ncbi:hypothetical protein F2P81_006453 [Scophthalmus maximus]|uniref:Uncharacterized protein n=1 Tax=Scophthalmus maximus TaxID=52904 RepID=A0A6A4T5Z5_SCOMX|nr:hypothetical protein F2P81_006453 [Scophthalmus maximus]